MLFDIYRKTFEADNDAFWWEEKHIIDHGMMVLCIYISSSCLYLSLLHGGVISAGSLLMQVDVAVSIK